MVDMLKTDDGLRPIDGGACAPEFPLSVLIVEDNPDDAELLLRTLRKAHFELQYTVVDSPAEFVAQLRTESYDVILSDYNLGPWTGLDALELLRRTPYPVPFILVTGELGERKAIECFKFGITDYVLKDNLDRLPPAVFRALDEQALRNEKAQADRLVKSSEGKFRALADAIPMAVFIEQGTQCCYANRAAEEITGYSRAELLEKNFWEMVLPSSKKALLDRVANSSSDTPCCSRYETQILTKTGETRWLDVSVGMFRIDGGLAALISAMDITKQRQPVERFLCADMPLGGRGAGMRATENSMTSQIERRF
jgi:PAS domain S-box-containing protein